MHDIMLVNYSELTLHMVERRAWRKGSAFVVGRMCAHESRAADGYYLMAKEEQNVLVVYVMDVYGSVSQTRVIEWQMGKEYLIQKHGAGRVGSDALPWF